MLRVERLEFASGFGFDRGEDQLGAIEAHTLGVLDFQFERGGGRSATLGVPSPHPAIRIGDRILEVASGRSFRGGERGDFEIRMAIESGEHLLPGDPGGPYHCDWNLHVCLRTWSIIAYRRRMRPSRHHRAKATAR